ncbi:hypothetical protein M378DRAFT_161625 [Amanita muscaria Koide BX008]|uniref:Uncharacterized protein n=1 Tax=Amanita muscaria (strain Koide BX008) TaxID=946122 RepID=A0A0C2XAV8_AMAMK|nr:hypothetical protein M378DRAFT_161625 [Amanita muscaria Koide BX008]
MTIIFSRHTASPIWSGISLRRGARGAFHILTDSPHASRSHEPRGGVRIDSSASRRLRQQLLYETHAQKLTTLFSGLCTRFSCELHRTSAELIRFGLSPPQDPERDNHRRSLMT